MHSSIHEQQPTATAKPRRDVLGFAKSVVDFFSGVTGLLAATLGILSSVAAVALASGGQPQSPPPPPPQTADRAEWIRSVNDLCAGAVLEGGIRVGSGDLTGYSAALRTISSGLQALPAPAGFEGAVTSAATDLEQAATAADAGDPTAVQPAARASATLTGLGVSSC